MKRHYSGYNLLERWKVLSQLRELDVLPLFSQVILEHVTFKFPDSNSAPRTKRVEIIGWANDERVQALLVTIDGQSVRPDGKLYHLTYSLGPGAKAMESNRMLHSKTQEGAIHKIEPFLISVKGF